MPRVFLLDNMIQHIEGSSGWRLHLPVPGTGQRVAVYMRPSLADTVPDVAELERPRHNQPLFLAPLQGKEESAFVMGLFRAQDDEILRIDHRLTRMSLVGLNDPLSAHCIIGGNNPSASIGFAMLLAENDQLVARSQSNRLWILKNAEEQPVLECHGGP